MGAANIAAAYIKWAGRVPPLSMVLLTYMALVSKDSDPQPWYGQGHAVLAAAALGRPDPTASDIRAVRRAITPLHEAGAITVERRASIRRDGRHTVRYRLNLGDTPHDTPCDTGRKPSHDTPPDRTENVPPEPPQDPPRRTVSDAHVGRFPAPRRTESVPHVGRKPSARGLQEEDEELDGGTRVALDTSPHPPRASRCPHGLKINTRPDGQPTCTLCRRTSTPPNPTLTTPTKEQPHAA